MRVEKALNRILSEENEEGDVLVISHASMLDALYRLNYFFRIF